MNKFRFRDFPVHEDARKFRLELRSVIRKEFPNEERFGLMSQIFRALDSVILNIAEGTDRGTDKDFAHFLNNSHTSLNEVVSCLDLACDDEYITDKDLQIFLKKAEKLANQITAFRKKLLDSPTK